MKVEKCWQFRVVSEIIVHKQFIKGRHKNIFNPSNDYYEIRAATN